MSQPMNPRRESGSPVAGMPRIETVDDRCDEHGPQIAAMNRLIGCATARRGDAARAPAAFPVSGTFVPLSHPCRDQL
jgi:hypothetical protein